VDRVVAGHSCLPRRDSSRCMLGLISFFALILQAKARRSPPSRTPVPRETGDSVQPSSTAGSAMPTDDQMWFAISTAIARNCRRAYRSRESLTVAGVTREDSASRRISTLAAASTLSNQSAKDFDPLKDKTKGHLDHHRHGETCVPRMVQPEWKLTGVRQMNAGTGGLAPPTILQHGLRS